MKISTLLFALALFSGPLMGQAKKAESAKEKPSEVYGNVGADSTLDKLIAIPDVDKIYKECDSSLKTKTEIPNCIWEKVKLNTSLKSQVMQVYNDSLKGKNKKDPISGRAPASTGKDSDKGMLTARELAVKTDYQSDPAVQALSDFYSKKLNEVLEGTPEEQKDKKIVTVDHEKFSQLYKSELGKNIVGAFTSYCLNTDPKTPTDCATTGICKYDPDKKQENMKLLKDADLSDKGVANNRWVLCISGIPKICYDEKILQGDEVSKREACLVMDFVKAARKNIISIDSQKKFYDELKKPTTMAFQNFKPMDAKKSDNDSLTQLTSNDLEKEFTNAKGEKTSVKMANEALVKEADECVANNQIKALDKCKKLLSTDVKENESALAEFVIRQEIQGEKLKEKLTDAKSVSDYLKEEGYTDDDVIKTMTDASTLEKTKQEITERFDAEKKAFIASMTAKIDAKTSTTQGSITNTVGDKDKLKAVKASFASRTQDLKDLIKFNNIVSSYLTVTDENNKTKPAERNTASLFAEIGSMSGDDAKDYQERLEASELSDKKNSTNLNVKEINEILHYKTEKLDPKKKAP